MTLGEKIKKARLDRHMTQRDVVGSSITRNMLSKIENNSATPSMKTLEFLAAQLNLPISYFVSENVVAVIPRSLQAAREAFSAGQYDAALALLEEADGLEDEQDETQLLCALCHLHLAAAASRRDDAQAALAHARAAMEANRQTIYGSEATAAKAALLAARYDEASFDRAMEAYHTARSSMGLDRLYHLTMAQHYLAAGQTQPAAAELAQLDGPLGQDPDSLRMQGELSMQQSDYPLAAQQLRRAEQLAVTAGSSEDAMAPLYAMLEQCYREMEDYKEAYNYAAKQIQR